MMRYFFIVPILIILIYSIILIFIYFYQRNLLYLPSENNYTSDQIKFDYEEVYIKVDSDIKLKSWFIEKDLKNYKTLVFFHGNAGNLFNRVHKLNKLNKLNINILLFSWRGFSGNAGSPNENNLYKDGKIILEWLNRQGVRSKNIILYGESLGTGVAVELAQENSFNSVILESPYTSMENAAKLYYPYLPVRLLLKDKFDSIEKINKIKMPILIMHGEEDSIVPFSMGVEMFEKANDPKYSFFPKNDDHMMEYNEQLISELESFIYKN